MSELADVGVLGAIRPGAETTRVAGVYRRASGLLETLVHVASDNLDRMWHLGAPSAPRWERGAGG